jgi:uncharacterized protein YcnI
MIPPRLLPLIAAAAAALAGASVAGAHGTLAPVEGAAGTTQRFELTVPGDRPDADVVAVALRLAPGMRLETATAEQPRWSVSSSAETVRWSGGPIARGSAETFAFSAHLPSQPGRVELTLTESWDDGPGAPFPIALLVTGAAPAGGTTPDTVAALALGVAVLALAVASLALAIALRSRRSRSQVDTPASGDTLPR